MIFILKHYIMSNKIKLNEELSRVKEIMGINNESTLSEGLGGLQIAMMAADEAANKISKMLVDEYSHFVGPQQEGGIKWTFMKQFYTSLNKMVLNQSDEEAYKFMGFTKSEDDGRTDYRDNTEMPGFEGTNDELDSALSIRK
jgi:hypothetical protein